MPFLKRLGLLPTYKFSLLCGTFAASIGLLAFILNWFLFNHSLTAYSLLLTPGNLVLSLFSEEINFIPKLILLVLDSLSLQPLPFGRGVHYNQKIKDELWKSTGKRFKALRYE